MLGDGGTGIVVQEMIELRKLLDEYKIEWHDASDPWEMRKIMSDILGEGKDGGIDRTHFYHRGFKWSIVNGFGTYGGISFRHGINQGKLELASNAVNCGEPIGYLAAKDCIELVLHGKNNEHPDILPGDYMNSGLQQEDKE